MSKAAVRGKSRSVEISIGRTVVVEDLLVPAPLSQSVTLTAGAANTITVSTGATFVLITPPKTNAIALTLKGVTGDTGILLHKTRPTLLALAAAQASFVLTAGAGTDFAVKLEWK